MAVAGVVLALIAAGSVLAASGVGTLVTRGEDRAATAQSAQAPVGAVSAGVQSEVQRSQPPTSDVDAEVQTNNAGTPAQGAPGGGSAPAASVGGGTGLPFTGFLAIPVLLAGALLLVLGIALRRRPPEPA